MLIPPTPPQRSLRFSVYQSQLFKYEVASLILAAVYTCEAVNSQQATFTELQRLRVTGIGKQQDFEEKTGNITIRQDADSVACSIKLQISGKDSLPIGLH